MNALDITFALFVDTHDIEGNLHHDGPLFHRWLPDGETDAIIVTFPDENAEVRIWCERRGYVDDRGYIRYDQKRREVDETIIPRQGVLDGGALFGRVRLRDLSAEQYNAVVNDEIDTDAYVALGKRVVKRLVDPILNRFVRILRDNYGQYWLTPPESFDSRERSLGSHCDLLNMKWSAPDGQTGAFLPTERTAERLVIPSGRPDYTEYIDRDAWFHISRLLQSDHRPLPAITLTSRVRRFLDEGRTEHALIEAVTAVDLAIGSYVRDHLPDDQRVRDATQDFWQLRLPMRVGLIGSIAGAPSATTTQVLEGIKARNDFVHEGKPLPAGCEEWVRSILEAVRQLSEPVDIRFPYSGHANTLMPSAKDWENKQ